MARKPPNTGDSGTVNKLQELGRRFETRKDLPSAPEADLIERMGAIIERQEQLRNSPNTIDPQTFSALEEKKLQIENRLDVLSERRMSIAAKQYTSGVSTATSAANLMRDVNSVAGSSSVLGAAARNVGMPTHELERMKANMLAGMVSTGANMAEMLQNDPENQRGINGMTNQLGNQIRGAAQAQATLDLQRRQGLDIRSRYLAAGESQERLESLLGTKDLSKQVAAGAFGTRADVEGQLRSNVNDIGRFREAQSRYADDPDKFERFQKAIDKLTSSAEKAANVLREMERTGTGMGGVADFFGSKKVQGGLQVVQAAANLGSAILDTWTYQNPLRERQNQTTYANIGNRQFDDTLSALGGDMGALRRLGSSYGAGQDANSMGKTGSKFSSALSTLGSVAGVGLALAGGIATATGVGAGIGIPLMMAGIGLAGVANSTAGNWNQQAGERGSSLAQAEIARRDALSKIDDFTAQSFVNMSKGLGSATVGLGSSRDFYFNNIGSKGGMAQLANTGLTPEMATALTGMGVQQMGGAFTSNAMIRAGQFRQSGLMNEAQTMQSLGSLSMVGGNAVGNLEEVLKNAVANGMDNSKSIAQMVEATVNLSSRSAAAGIDVVSGSGMAVSKIMDQLEEQNVPINMRGGVAQNSLSFANETLGNKGLNLNNIAEWQQMAKALPGASGAQLRKLSTMRVEEFEQLRGPNGAAFARQVGIGSLVLDETGAVDPAKMKKLQEIEYTKLVNTVLPRGLNEQARQDMLRAGSFDEFKRTAKPGEMEDFLAIASEKGINLGATLGVASTGRARAGTIPTGPSAGEVGEIERQRVADAQGQVKVLEQGREIITALGGLKGLTTALEGLAKNFDPKEMSKGVKDAAGSFTVPVQKFSDAVEKFASALDKTSKK